MNGSININNSTVTSTNLSFDVFNQLNNISLKGYESGNNYKLKIKGLSHVRLKNLLNIKNVNLDGKTILKSNVDLTFKPNKKYDYDVSVNGVLHDMRTNLPFPLDTKPQKNKLMVFFKGSDKKDLIKARFNNVELGARNENSSSKSSYWEYSINNYDKEKKLDLLQWIDSFSALNTAHATNSNSGNKAYKFNIKFNKLYLGNTIWKNISLDNEIKNNKIKLQLKGKQIKGFLLLDNNNLIANFDKIYVQSVKSSKKVTNKPNAFSSIDDKSVFNNWLKSIRVQVNDLKFNKVQLGTLFTLIEKNDSKISMPVLSLFNNNNYVKASGLWTKSKGNFKTKLDISAKSKNIDQVLKNILSNYPLRDQNISGNLSLNWLGSPFNPQLGTLNGTSNLISNNGKIIDLNSQVNILSFLSVQSLLIKIQDGMKGDFSGGLNYDKIEIRSLIKNGTIFINKAQMSSPNLNLSLNGKVDLYRKKLI
ncbi:YhdP family protein [Paraphotobacterium marinum]